MSVSCFTGCMVLMGNTINDFFYSEKKYRWKNYQVNAKGRPHILRVVLGSRLTESNTQTKQQTDCIKQDYEI